ncbi:MAG TPA: hypothetical protein VMZ28_22805 [Kofleriaceae bacterium]|nr:hypothetical protein [Kofleriaceae bacterium]
MARPVSIERAREHVFMAGVDDSGARLCEANVPYGLAKIHHAQAAMGLPADASFVGSPDCTVTRNERRWSQGFGYGGVYQWSGDFAVLDIKTNSCGMLAGSLPRLPALEEVRERLHVLDREPLELDGIPLDNDLTESNHFVDVFTVDAASSAETLPGGARNAFIMHSSGHELRGATAAGPGLYWDESQELRAMAREVDTPWGTLRVLEGDAARRWFEFYRRVQDFTHRRRELIARHLFGDFDVVVNATHQGLVRGVNQANIGCYHYDDPAPGEEPLFPLTLSATLPAFLVRGQKNLGDDAVARLGWGERLERHGLEERIRSTNVLPHGGGYRFPRVRGVARVIEDGPDRRRFELTPADPDGEVVAVETPRPLAYEYRGLEVKQRLEELALGRTVVKLDLDYVLTA